MTPRAILLVCLSLLAPLSANAQNQARYAVVRISSHGGSGVVIARGNGKSLILSAAHMFQGAAEKKAIRLDAPSPAPGQPARVGVRLLSLDRPADLALIVVDAELPYVAVLAPPGVKPSRCLSVGFDEMRLPPQVKPALVVGEDSLRYFTREKPWHGRSGGALLDAESGKLVGVVQGYEVAPNGRGIYSSASAIRAFLSRCLNTPGVPRPELRGPD